MLLDLDEKLEHVLLLRSAYFSPRNKNNPTSTAKVLRLIKFKVWLNISTYVILTKIAQQLSETIVCDWISKSSDRIRPTAE